MTVKLLTEHHLEFPSLKGGCTGSSELHMSKCHIVGNHMSWVIFARTCSFIPACRPETLANSEDPDEMLHDAAFSSGYTLFAKARMECNLFV